MATTKEIYDNIIASVEAKIQQTVPLLPRSFTRVMAAAFAGVFTVLAKYADFMLLQLWPQTASTKSTRILGVDYIPLVMLGRRNGAGDPKKQQTARWQVFIQSSGTGWVIPAGTQLTTSVNGVVYETEAPIQLDNVITPGEIVSLTPGAAGNKQPGEVFIFSVSNPNYSDVASSGASPLVEGTDEESWAQYRERVILRDQMTPQGGAYFDYYTWGIEVAGVSRVYAYTGDPGQVNVYIEGTPIGTEATQVQITSVEQQIQLDDAGLASRRPAGSLVNVDSVDFLEVNLTVSGLAASDPSTTMSNIQAALDDFFESVEPFIEGLTPPPSNNVIRASAIETAVYNTVAEDGATIDGVDVVIDGSTVSERPLQEGDRVRLGTVVFI